jgi:hypothetical protein
MANTNLSRDRYLTMSADELRALSDEGDAEAQFQLGLRHFKGEGAAKDLRAAFALWSKAAQLDHPFAQNNLALLYEAGEGTAQNSTKAFFWYRKAAARGYDVAQVNVGKMYQRGAGTSRDLKAARSWYEKAAAQDNREALSLLEAMPSGLPSGKKLIIAVTLLATLPWAYYCVMHFRTDGWWRLFCYIAAPPILLLSFALRSKKQERPVVHLEYEMEAAPAPAPQAPAPRAAPRSRAAPVAANPQPQSPAQTRDMSDQSRMYLDPKKTGYAYPPEHFAYSKLLDDPRLDFSVASLDHIDALLDSIRKRDKPDFAAFLDKQQNQNFLLVLCFYVGEVMAKHSGQNITWLDYDSMLKAVPGNGAMFPRCFQTVVTCVLDRKGFFVPLSSICSRLFEESPDKSVRFSAEGFM